MTPERYTRIKEIFLSACDKRLHFGLGPQTHLDSIHVRWPNGATELFDPPASSDRIIELTEGTGRGGNSEDRSKLAR